MHLPSVSLKYIESLLCLFPPKFDGRGADNTASRQSRQMRHVANTSRYMVGIDGCKTKRCHQITHINYNLINQGVITIINTKMSMPRWSRCSNIGYSTVLHIVYKEHHNGMHYKVNLSDPYTICVSITKMV